MMAPIRTKTASPPRVASSPTHDIVDNLLGAVVGSHLTKEHSASPTQPTLLRSQVGFRHIPVMGGLTRQRQRLRQSGGANAPRDGCQECLKNSLQASKICEWESLFGLTVA